MKRVAFLIIVIIVLLMTGCDDTLNTYADFLGEWDFSEGVHISILDVGPPASNNVMFDISKSEKDEEENVTFVYFAAGDGSIKRNTITGFYDFTTYNPDNTTNNLNITIKLTLENSKLKAICTGEGPLQGKTFTSGIRSDL